MSKLHYFDQLAADTDDIKLKMCIAQGYVPKTCLLGGMLVWAVVCRGGCPCIGCNGPREICHGKPKEPNEFYGM